MGAYFTHHSSVYPSDGHVYGHVHGHVHGHGHVAVYFHLYWGYDLNIKKGSLFFMFQHGLTLLNNTGSYKI